MKARCKSSSDRRRQRTVKRKNIMDASDISRASTRLAHELIERNKGPPTWC